LNTESNVSNSSPLSQDFDRIERLALLFASLVNHTVPLFNDGAPDPRGGSNEKKGKSNRRNGGRQNNDVVVMFAIGAVSMVFMAAIIVMAVAGLSAKTIIPLAALTFIFVITVWLALRGRG